MTAKEIHEKIEQFKIQTEKLMEENPYIEQIEWRVQDVPYKIFNEFRNSLPGNDYSVTKEQISCGGKVYCRPVICYGRGCSVYVWSVPVKIKQTVEVIEEELKTETI